MKKPLSLLFVLLLLITLLFFSNCHYDNLIVLPSSNIILYDKPLDVIRVNVQGKWKLQKVTGGFIYQVIIPKDNSYMNIYGDNIVIGNNKRVAVDTTIVWVKDDQYYHTWLLSYRAFQFNNYPFPNYEIVQEIKNDTLVIADAADDAYRYYYLRSNN